MTTAIKRRRGTTTQHSTFTGLEGEITVDTTKDTLVVHDGTTAGGFALLREDLSNNTNVITATNTKTLTNKTVDLASNTLTGTTAQFNAALSDNDFATLAGTETLSNKTFSTNPTISSGTANGVAYLNGSKVLTTGSALTFDGTTLGVANGVTGGTALSLTGTYASSGAVAFINFQRAGGAVAGTLGYDDANTAIRFGTTTNHSTIFLQNNTEQMRLTSTGLGIGTSSPTAKLTVDGGHLNFPSSAYLYSYGGATTGTLRSGFQLDGTNNLLLAFTNNTERMRIDSSGNLLVGKTAASVSNVGFETGPSGSTTSTMASSTNSQSTWNVYSTGAAAYRFYVGMGGTVYATSTSISAISDQRLKENVRDLDVGLDAVLALKPRVFDWKEGNGKDIKNDRGFIAQEFEQVFPDLIDEWKDPAPEGEEPYKSVRQDLIPVLVKAIQELKAELDATKAEVAALKGN